MNVRCPICRNASGIEADGTVVRKYRPQVKGGKVQGALKPLYTDQLECAHCGTVLLVREKGEWVTARRIK